jgi:hypothetical protein
MSVASVNGRNRERRLTSALQTDPQHLEKRRIALAGKRAAQPKSALPLHVLYMRAWRKAGKPADFPSCADWIKNDGKWLDRQLDNASAIVKSWPKKKKDYMLSQFEGD